MKKIILLLFLCSVVFSSSCFADTYEKLDKYTLGVIGVKEAVNLKDLRSMRQHLIDEIAEIDILIKKAEQLGIKEE